MFWSVHHMHTVHQRYVTTASSEGEWLQSGWDKSRRADLTCDCPRQVGRLDESRRDSVVHLLPPSVVAEVSSISLSSSAAPSAL